MRVGPELTHVCGQLRPETKVLGPGNTLSGLQSRLGALRLAMT